MKKIFLFGCALLALCSLQNCNTSTPFPYGREWELEQLNGEQVPAGTRITVQFDEANKISSGTTSCNTFKGLFKVEGGSLRFAQQVTTKMMCPDMSWEQKYMPALMTIDSWKVDGGKLHLLKGGASVAIYK
jgi:heat shock protein HslJ